MKEKWQFSNLYPFLFTIVFVVILFQYPFSSLESIFYDFRIKYDFGISKTSDIILITLDEESDEYLGENLPYTYTTHLRLLTKILPQKPASVGYLLNLNENVTQRDRKSISKIKKLLKNYISSGGYFSFGLNMSYWEEEQKPPFPFREYPYQFAILNVDNSTFAKDDVSRKGLLNISGNNTFHLETANHFRNLNKLQTLNTKDVSGSYYVNEADASFFRFRYFTNPLPSKNNITTIPFHKVVIGIYPENFFKNKIILIGSKYISDPDDYIQTPFNTQSRTVSKLSLHAELIESLIQNKSITAASKNVSYTISILLAIFLSFFISRVKPTRGLVITVGSMISVLLLSYILFSIFGIWIYLAHIVLTIFVVYYIWIPFRAIGEYQRRFAIQEETKLIKKVEHLKRNFISLMSHDLKTPVAKIAGLADITLKQSDLSTIVKDNVTSIYESTKELNKFITSILDLSKIESSDLSLNLVSKDINKIIEEIADRLNFEARVKKMKIHKELGPLYPINIDVTLMNRVLSNLIENAIKYSGDDTEIFVKTHDDEKWVYVEIRDTGAGIHEDSLEHIFDKFYRVQNDASHIIKGSGLGLYLVKYFVELHGGEISVESKIGQGTVFIVKLKNE